LNESNYTQARPRDEDGDGGNDGGSDGKDVLFNSTAIKPRIIGGTPTIAGRFPYHVSLLNQFGGHSCGGTLIAPDLVLTAAHCDELSAAHVGRYDRLNPSEPFEQYTIVEQTIHPAYQPVYFNYDFMILKLSGSAQRFPVVTLNTDPNLPSTEPDSNRVTAVGFGVTEYDFETGTTNDPSYILQTVDLQAITNEQCEQSKDLDNTEAMYRNGYKGLITADMLCADGQGDTCLGDSGGPLIVPGSDLSGYEDVQVGVTSWGFGCGSVGT
jgi:secreted trypsin-like serine protease